MQSVTISVECHEAQSGRQQSGMSLLRSLYPSGARLEENYSGTDEDGSVYNDGASVTSETSTVHGDLEDGGGGVDESSKMEIFESKLKEALELATQKSAGGRVKALDSLCSAFQKRYCPDLIENQQVTCSRNVVLCSNELGSR